MFRKNRCYDNTRPMENSQTSFTFSGVAETQEYPTAMPNQMNQNIMYNQNMSMNMPSNSCPMPPVYECPQERVVNREFVHEVPHICPVNTRIINHHIYRHTYTPCYTCCEENVCSNVYDNNCCNFR